MRLLLVTNFCYLLLPYLTQAGSFTDDLGNEFNFDGGEKVVAYSLTKYVVDILWFAKCIIRCSSRRP